MSTQTSSELQREVAESLSLMRVGLGAMALTGPGAWGPPRDPDDALRLLRRAVDLGIAFIDTADSYGPDVSERLIADALHPYSADLVIATKGGFVREGPWRITANGHPEHLRAACEGSLRRLKLDRIELYQLHAVDPKVPLEESVGTLADLRHEGKIANVGLSNVSVDQIQRARNVVPIVSVQNHYSLLEREEDPVLAFCERESLAFIPWSPLAKGALAAKGGVLGRIASTHGWTPAQVALAWLLARSPSILAIPGTSSSRHLEENVGAASLVLDEEELRALEAARPSPAVRARAGARRLARRVLGPTGRRLARRLAR